MDRYKIALNSPDILSSKIFFKSSNNVINIYDNLKTCIEDNLILRAGNLNLSVLDSAVIKISKEYGVPIIVGNENIATILSVSYSYQKVYTPETIPEKFFSGICYFVKASNLPEKLEPFLIVEK